MSEQERQEIEKEHQLIEAETLIGKMQDFTDSGQDTPMHSYLTAKYCAKVACDYLIENLPNINNTPPALRNNERTYGYYWRGVKSELENVKL